MKAVVLKANGILAYEEMATPEVTTGMVRIRVVVCGICGSDIPRVFDCAARHYPIVLGHEFAGVIDAVGEGVNGLQIGDHVTAAPLIPCHQCADCEKGNYSLCSHYSFIGSRQQGAMAEYIVVPAQNVIPISKKIPFEQAATIEPATVALHAMRQMNYVAGKRVAVLGCGIIGLYAIQWAKLLGASSVSAIGRGEIGLNAAKELGADECFSTKEVAEEDVLQKLDQKRFDYVIESSGSMQTIQISFQIVAKKGTICLIGTPKKELSFSVSLWEQLNRKECWITGSWMSYSAPFPGDEWTMTIEEMENGRLKLINGMTYGLYDMAQAEEAFRVVHNGEAKGRVLLMNTSM